MAKKRPRINRRELEDYFLQYLEKAAKRKRTKKATPPKKVVEILPTRLYHKRGTNRISIVFPDAPNSPEMVYDTVVNFDYSKFDYMRRWNKPDGHHYKPPQGIIVIITIQKNANEYHRTRVTDFDYVINKESIKKFVIQTIDELLKDYSGAKEFMSDEENEPIGEEIGADYIEDFLDPAYIKEITIVFIYGLKGEKALEQTEL